MDTSVETLSETEVCIWGEGASGVWEVDTEGADVVAVTGAGAVEVVESWVDATAFVSAAVTDFSGEDLIAVSIFTVFSAVVAEAGSLEEASSSSAGVSVGGDEDVASEVVGPGAPPGRGAGGDVGDRTASAVGFACVAACTGLVGTSVAVVTLVRAGDDGAVLADDVVTGASGVVVEAMPGFTGHVVGSAVVDCVVFNELVCTVFTGVVVIVVVGMDALVCVVVTGGDVTGNPGFDGHVGTVLAAVVVIVVAAVGGDVDVGFGEADELEAGTDVGVMVVGGGRAGAWGKTSAAVVLVVVTGFTVVVTAGATLAVVVGTGTGAGAGFTVVVGSVGAAAVETVVLWTASGPVVFKVIEPEGFGSSGALEA